jgi:type II secretory pathway pseudopilin PulG
MLKNKNGFTMVEVMIAAALLIIVGLAFSSLIFHQGNQQKSMSAKGSFNSLVNSVQNAANNPNVLKKSAEATQ